MMTLAALSRGVADQRGLPSISRRSAIIEADGIANIHRKGAKARRNHLVS